MPNNNFNNGRGAAPPSRPWPRAGKGLGVLRPVPWKDVMRRLFLAVHAYAYDMQPLPSPSSHTVNYYATTTKCHAYYF